MIPNFQKRSYRLLATSAALFALAACDQSSPPTVGQKIDSGIESTQKAATEATQNVQDATAQVKQDASEAGSAIADGAVDAAITTQLKAALAADDQLSALDIKVETDKGVVSLTGPAPSAEAVEHATTMAKAISGVTEVNNQLTVEPKN